MHGQKWWWKGDARLVKGIKCLLEKVLFSIFGKDRAIYRTRMAQYFRFLCISMSCGKTGEAHVHRGKAEEGRG